MERRLVATCRKCGAQRGMAFASVPSVARGGSMVQGFEYFECPKGHRNNYTNPSDYKPLRSETVKATEVKVGDIMENNGDPFRVSAVDTFGRIIKFYNSSGLSGSNYEWARGEVTDEVVIWERDK